MRRRRSLLPALTDFIFMVQGANMFITGPPQVIKTVTGEEVSADELGGATTHNTVSGVAHFMCDTEDDCFLAIRKLISYLPANNLEDPPRHKPWKTCQKPTSS